MFDLVEFVSSPCPRYVSQQTQKDIERRYQRQTLFFLHLGASSVFLTYSCSGCCSKNRIPHLLYSDYCSETPVESVTYWLWGFKLDIFLCDTFGVAWELLTQIMFLLEPAVC